MICLIGEKDCKRYTYFKNAAEELNEEFLFMDINNIEYEKLKDCFVKIDPEIHNSSDILKIGDINEKYINKLREIQKVKGIKFLNHPEGLIELLNKEVCKKKILDASIKTTQLICLNIESYEELKYIMNEKKVYSVFIKPSLGSGAAGIAALRYNPKMNKSILQTSSFWNGGKLTNTKKIHLYKDEEDITNILNELFNINTIVEKWIPKAKYGELSYDLRAVYELGEIVFWVVRCSSNAITNLHLNNKALEFKMLSLSEEKIKEIETLCFDAMKLFPNVNVAGIDILLSKDNLNPYIIEINGQGDLIYQDIYNENIIYKKQIEEMRKQFERP